MKVRCQMIHRCFVSISILTPMLAVASLASVSAGGQAPAAAPQGATATTSSPPRTPWGEPDLQGVWRYEGVTPMERPKEFGSREFFTDAELAQRLETANKELAAKV